jgi:hypothetical protein
MTVFDDDCVLAGGMVEEALEMNAVRPTLPHWYVPRQVVPLGQ